MKQNKELRNNTYKYAHLIFDKDTQQFNGEGQPLQQMVLEQLDIHRSKM